LGDKAALEFAGKRITGPELADAMYHIAGQQIKLLNLMSPGSAGEVIEVPDMTEVKFVQVQRRTGGVMSGTVGDIGIGYYGDDPNVNLPNEFAIYNTGDKDLPLKSFLLCM